jgi:hypothetical protein
MFFTLRHKNQKAIIIQFFLFQDVALCEKFIHEFFSQLLVAINDFDLHILVFLLLYLYVTYWYPYYGTTETSI